MQDYHVKLLEAMLQTYSPSGAEKELATLLTEHMNSQGYTVRTDMIGNVIGEIGDAGPRILLCGHMDTVPGEIPVKKEGNFLYGRGAVDAKSSLAAMIIAGQLAKQENPSNPFRLTVAAVTEEERSSAGVKALISEKKPYDLAVFGEPSGATNITIGYKGSLHLQVTCLTNGGHSAAPWLSKNSIEEMFAFWKSLETNLLENNSPSRFSAITGCITRANSGAAGNSIPPSATIEIDIRIPPGTKPAQVEERIAAFTNKYQSNQHNETIRIQVTVQDQAEPYLGDQNSLAVRAFRWAIHDALDAKVTLIKKTGTSDMNLFAKTYPQTPMIAYGPGDSSLDHTENERIDLAEYCASIQVITRAIQKFTTLTTNTGSRPTLPTPAR